jgi:hypothetical protein
MGTKHNDIEMLSAKELADLMDYLYSIQNQ